MIRITPTSRPTHRPPVVGNDPGPSGCCFFAARDPAIASAGMIMKNRPTNIAMASVSDQNGLEAVRPAKAEPLFAVAEVKA